MSELSHAPFELGTTLSGKDADGNLINRSVLGQVYEFPVSAATASDNRGNKSRLTGKVIRAVALRNESGITLLGARIARLTATAGYSLVTSVDGYAGAGYANANIVVIDDKLGTTGVADDDIFWGVIAGPQNILVEMDGSKWGGDISVGNLLVNATGTTTGATTSGRLANVTLTNATAGGTTIGVDVINVLKNRVGIALSAKTTQQTTAGQDCLVDVRINW